MEKTEKTKAKRSWVKNAAIIFLVVMLVLTFFSNTIMNWSLPEVSGQYTGRGSITSGIRSNGVVKANVAYNVTISEGREIEKVNVKTDDTVEAGDVLFTLTEKDSTEVEAAVAAVENAQYQYQLKLLQRPFSNVEDTSEEIKDIEKQIAEAKTAYDEQVILSRDILASGTDFEAIIDQEKEVNEKIADRIAAINEKAAELKEAADKLSAKLAEITPDLKGELSGNAGYEDIAVKQVELQTLTDAYDDAKDAFDELSVVTAEVTNAQKAVDAAQAALDTANKSVDAAQNAWLAAEEVYDSAVDTKDMYNRAYDAYERAKTVWEADPSVDNKSIMDYHERAYTALELKLATESQMRQYDDAIDDAAAAYYKTIETRDEAQTTLNEAKAELSKVKENNKNSTVSDAQYDAAELLMKNSEKAKLSAEKELSKLVNTATREIKAQQNEIKLQQVDNNALLADAQDEKADSDERIAEAEKPGAAKDNIEALEKQLILKQNALQTSKNQAEIDELTYQKTLNDLYNTLENAKEALEKAQTSKINKEVTAKYAGTISSISVMAGDEVMKDQTLCQIEVNGKGYTASISVTNEQASMVKVGDEATVNNFWWGNISVVLSAIKVDRTSPSTKKVLEFAVEGDVSDGQSLELTIGNKTTNYNNVVPNSAVREDSDGNFILIATPKSTPLGNRYIATRVDVTVLESDDYNSAIDTGSGGGGYSYIIVSSSKPVDAGMQVRLVET